MTIARTILFSLIALVAASTASAASFDHIDRLALKLASQFNELPREFSQHYRHTSDYNHLIHDAREAAELADHIHELAHHGSSASHMLSDLNKLDREFHHLESVLANANRRVRYGYGGHTHGDTRHVAHLMHEIEDNLHHLRDDIEAMVRYRPAYQAPVYRQPVPVYHNNHNGHGHSNRGVRVNSQGVTVGNGRVSFRIGF